MKSDQIKHSLAVGTKSIQSRVYDSETNELISFVKMPLEEAELVRREWHGLTEQEFLEACQIAERGNYLVAFQRIQAKLKEKNHDTH